MVDQQGSILIVDDKEMLRMTLGMLLEDEGYQLFYAADGQEALSKAIQHVPDLILLDVMMPEMNGFDVCRRLRAHKVLAEVPVIMLTALNNRQARLDGLAAGADDFITKPFDHIELRTRIQSIMRLNRYRQLLVERVRFRWVVEQAEEGYIVLGEEDVVAYTSPRARHYFGLPEHDPAPITVPFLELAKQRYHCEPQESWDSWPKPVISSAPRYLVQPETASARSFWLQVDVLNLPVGAGMTATVRLKDVTDKMSTLRDMRSFNASVTHKLLTPLIHVTGNLELLDKYYRTQMDNPDIGELFEVALRGSRRLKHEIDEIIQYTRKLSLVVEGEDALHIAELPALVQVSSIELGLETVQMMFHNCDSGACLALSSRAVALILAELLENAQKFHPQHTPVVDITITGMPENASFKNGAVCIQVADGARDDDDFHAGVECRRDVPYL